MMEEYKPNSHKFKEEQKQLPPEKKKVEKIVTTPAKIKKKNEVRKIADVFISEDVANVKSYIFMDVLVPAIKKAISDIVTDGIDMILYGGTGRSKKNSPVSRVSYRDYYGRDRRYEDHRSSRRRFSYEYITVDSRGEAEQVLSAMDEMIDMYGIVTIADLCDMVDVTCDYTDYKYGWKNIRNAEPVRERDGSYSFKLPKAIPID